MKFSTAVLCCALYCQLFSVAKSSCCSKKDKVAEDDNNNSSRDEVPDQNKNSSTSSVRSESERREDEKELDEKLGNDADGVDNNSASGELKADDNGPGKTTTDIDSEEPVPSNNSGSEEPTTDNEKAPEKDVTNLASTETNSENLESGTSVSSDSGGLPEPPVAPSAPASHTVPQSPSGENQNVSGTDSPTNVLPEVSSLLNQMKGQVSNSSEQETNVSNQIVPEDESETGSTSPVDPLTNTLTNGDFTAPSGQPDETLETPRPAPESAQEQPEPPKLQTSQQATPSFRITRSQAQTAKNVTKQPDYFAREYKNPNVNQKNSKPTRGKNSNQTGNKNSNQTGNKNLIQPGKNKKNAPIKRKNK